MSQQANVLNKSMKKKKRICAWLKGSCREDEEYIHDTKPYLCQVNNYRYSDECVICTPGTEIERLSKLF